MARLKDIVDECLAVATAYTAINSQTYNEVNAVNYEDNDKDFPMFLFDKRNIGVNVDRFTRTNLPAQTTYSCQVLFFNTYTETEKLTIDLQTKQDDLIIIADRFFAELRTRTQSTDKGFHLGEISFNAIDETHNEQLIQLSYTVQFIANIENCDLGTFDDYLEYVNLIINEVETIQITDSTTFNLTVTLDGVESGSYNSTTKTWEVESEPCPPTEIDITFDSIPLGTATTSPYNIDCDTLIQVIIVSNADYPALNGNYVYSGIYQTVNEYTHDTLPNTFIRRVAGEWRVFNTINTIYQNDPSVYEYPYEATYDECTLVQGTIEDYCSEPCADATYTIKDRDETTLYSGSIASGGDLQQYIENTTIEVNDTSFADVVAQGHLNIQVVNSENTQKGSKVGNDWLLPDTTYNIYLDGVFDQSVSLPTLGNDNLTITLVTP